MAACIVAQQAGSTTADLLQKKFDEAGFSSMLQAAEAAERDGVSSAAAWVPASLRPIMPR